MEFTAWRDMPKPGETDAQWCAKSAKNGHVICIVSGYTSEEQALAAIGAETNRRETNAKTSL